MTKEELFNLARNGSVRIEQGMSYVVTRYRIEPAASPPHDDDTAAYVELSE